MASSSLTVIVGNKELRKYGGTRFSVRCLYSHYKTMSLEEFLSKHKNSNEEEYKSLKLVTKFNKS